MLPRRDPAASLVGDFVNSLGEYLGDALEYLRQARPAPAPSPALLALLALLALHVHCTSTVLHDLTLRAARQAFVDVFTEP